MFTQKNNKKEADWNAITFFCVNTLQVVCMFICCCKNAVVFNRKHFCVLKNTKYKFHLFIERNGEICPNKFTSNKVK